MMEKKIIAALSWAGRRMREKLSCLVRLQPRFGFHLTAVVFSLLLVQSTLAVPGSRAEDGPSPTGLLATVERQASLAYTRALRLVDDFRLVYEVHSQLQPAAPNSELAPAATPVTPNPSVTCSSRSLRLGPA